SHAHAMVFRSVLHFRDQVDPPEPFEEGHGEFEMKILGGRRAASPIGREGFGDSKGQRPCQSLADRAILQNSSADLGRLANRSDAGYGVVVILVAPIAV